MKLVCCLKNAGQWTFARLAALFSFAGRERRLNCVGKRAGLN
jgi:hypothetical protein